MSDYLLKGAISDAVNFPSITAEEAPRIRPVGEARRAARPFAGRSPRPASAASASSIRARWPRSTSNRSTAAALAGVLRPLLADVNMVFAAVNAKERGHAARGGERGQDGAFESYVKLTVKTDEYDRSIAGTVFSDGARASSRCAISAWSWSWPRTCYSCATPTGRASSAASAW